MHADILGGIDALQCFQAPSHTRTLAEAGVE